jgi:hypothetical protein
MKILGVMACKEDIPEYVRRIQKKLFEALSEARSQEEIAIFSASKIPATMPNLGPGYILKTCFDALLPARRLHNPDLLFRQCVQLVHQSVDLPVRAFDLPLPRSSCGSFGWRPVEASDRKACCKCIRCK